MKETIKKAKSKIEVVPTNSFDINIYSSTIENSICAVIDTIRATSTMVTIFGSGCKRVILAKEKSEAYILKDIFKDHLLCGEQGGIKPEDFDYDNSPYAFSKLDLRKKDLIMLTSNGTVSFFNLIKARYAFAISILNLGFALDVILKLAESRSKDIFIVCSGIKGKITYDDIYTAGLAVKYLTVKSKDYEVTDSAMVAYETVGANKNIMQAFDKSISGRISRTLGYENDLNFIAKLNNFNLVPALRVIDLYGKQNEETREKFKDLFSNIPKLQKNYPNKQLLTLELFDVKDLK